MNDDINKGGLNIPPPSLNVLIKCDTSITSQKLKIIWNKGSLK